MQKFVNALQDVVSWNATANMGENDLSNEAIQRQLTYIQSELRETVAAAATSNDIEVIDGVADVFVTLGYLLFQKGVTYTQILDFCTEEDYLKAVNEYSTEPAGKKQMEMAIANISTEMYWNVLPDNLEVAFDTLLNDMFGLLAISQYVYKVDMFDVIGAVMRANWSKYPLAADVLQPEDECRAIEATGYTNVRYAMVTVDRKEHYVFRDAYGHGKIRKPSTYAAPTEALRAMLAAVA